jgi:hypothetical protein
MRLLAAALLAAGLVGLAVCWATWPRSAGTSPLAALFSLLWSGTYLAAAILTWRGSRLAPAAFVAAIGLLLPVVFFIFPEGGASLLPVFLVVCLFALLGCRYLGRARQPTA